MKQLGLFILGTALAGCSGGGGGSGGGGSTEPTKSLTISGSIGGSLSSVISVYDSDIRPMASEYKVRCVTLSGPLHAGEGVVNTSDANKFAVSMTAGLNAPLGCFLLKDSTIAAVFSFASGTSMSGSGTKHQTSYAPKSDSTELSLGNITITGAVAAAGTIEENGTADDSALALGDMTGSWKVASVYENADEGFVHPCLNEVGDENPAALAACKVQWTAGNFFLHMYKATNAPAAPRFGFALWENKAAFDACGGKENISVGGGWTIDTTYNDYATNVTGGFGTPTFNFQDLTAALAQAPFKKWVDPNSNPTQTNCPSYDHNGNMTELAGCETATSCASFDYSVVTDLEARSRVKLMCVMNALSSGGNQGYQWGNVCGRRMGQSIWNMLHPQDPNTAPAMDSVNGNGCAAANCGLTIPWENEPTLRHFESELFVSGNIGSASRTDEETEHVQSQDCKVMRSMAFTVTRVSANAATVVVEQSMARKPGAAGNEWDEATCLGANGSDWLKREMDKVFRFKINLTK